LRELGYTGPREKPEPILWLNFIQFRDLICTTLIYIGLSIRIEWQDAGFRE